MEELNLRNYAHLGDAVWELKVREKTIYQTSHTKDLHKLTTKYVNAGHQAELLRLIEPFLTESEQEQEICKFQFQEELFKLIIVKRLHLKF